MAASASASHQRFSIQSLIPASPDDFYLSLKRELGTLKTNDQELFKTVEVAINSRLFALLAILNQAKSVKLKKQQKIEAKGEFEVVDKTSLENHPYIFRTLHSINAEICDQFVTSLLDQTDAEFEGTCFKINNYVIHVFELLESTAYPNLSVDSDLKDFEMLETAKPQKFKEYYQNLNQKIKEGKIYHSETREISQMLIENFGVLSAGGKVRFHKNGFIRFENDSNVGRAAKSKFYSSVSTYLGGAYFGYTRPYSTDLENLTPFIEFVQNFCKNVCFSDKSDLFKAFQSAIRGLESLANNQYRGTTKAIFLKEVCQSLGTMKVRLSEKKFLPLIEQIKVFVANCPPSLDDKGKMRWIAFHLNDYFMQVDLKPEFKQFPNLIKLAKVKNFEISLFVACLIVSHRDTDLNVDEKCKNLLSKIGSRFVTNETLMAAVKSIYPVITEILEDEEKEREIAAVNQHRKKEEFALRRSEFLRANIKLLAGAACSYLGITNTRWAATVLPVAANWIKEGWAAGSRFLDYARIKELWPIQQQTGQLSKASSEKVEAVRFLNGITDLNSVLVEGYMYKDSGN